MLEYELPFSILFSSIGKLHIEIPIMFLLSNFAENKY